MIFAPTAARPLLLGLVRVRNGSNELVRVDYTELWDLSGERVPSGAGAATCRLPAGKRALADAGTAIRARLPKRRLEHGLALELVLPLPPRATRELWFCYAAPGPDESAATLVRAWRGQVAGELARCWRAYPHEPNSVAAYRVQALQWSGF